MDFPGGASTNIYLIDGFSTIYWRIYTEEASIANNPSDGPASGYTILKHLGRLKDLEARLRNLSCLASCPRRLGLWIFSPTPAFERLRPLYVKEGDEESKRISFGATTLKVSASGSISSQELIKGLSSESQTTGSNATASQKPQQSQNQTRRSDGYNTSAAIYASFISAITGAISIHLVRNHGALPLGSRTLFTALEKIGYQSPRIDNQSLFSTPCLTTLNVQLNGSGTVTVALQTIPQIGIIRLCSAQDDPADLLQTPPGIDLWLCPNGAVARLVTANVESPAVPTSEDGASESLAAKRKQWQSDVFQWLENFGLYLESIEEEVWVEVEVWEPFFARLAGDAWRQGDESRSSLPLKRILWPARFCFRRTSPSAGSSWPQMPLEDPLEFAERWFSESASLGLDRLTENSPPTDQTQSNDHEMASLRDEGVEGFESLSRMAQYPDLQTTNMVYPTPPDGAVVMGISNATSSDAFVDEHDFLSPDGVKSISNPPTTLNIAVGTGRYDASDDEDLFGEMNDRDFGSKGITDADFSFFDDPGLANRNDHSEMAMDLVDTTRQPAVEVDKVEELMMEDNNQLVDKPSEPLTIIKASAPNTHYTRIEQQIPAMADEPTGPSGSFQASPDTDSQPISPPLSPVAIKKLLLPSSKPNEREGPCETRLQQGQYHPVEFRKRLGEWNEKYGSAGKFFFPSGNTADALEATSNPIPTVGLPHRSRAGMTASRIESGGSHSSPENLERHARSSSVSTIASSIDSEENIVEDHSTPNALPTLKRKRVPSDSDIQSAASPAKSSTIVDGNVGLKVEHYTFLGNFLANFSDWTFTGYFSAFEVEQLPVLLRQEEQISIAQILVEQITQSSLDHALGGCVGLCSLESEIHPLRTHLEETRFLGEVTKLDLKGYASLYEDAVLSNLQTQQVKDSGIGSICRLEAPHLRVCRGKEFLEILPPAMSFWEAFGLEPAYGPKNISAYCIHPHAAAESAEVFLNRLGLLYQSCNLGTHTRGNGSLAFEQGLKEWTSNSSDYTSMVQSLQRLCEELGADLCNSSMNTDNCVIYIINPYPHAAALADICTSFWHLFQQVVADAGRRQARQVNEIVLQIVPIDFIMLGDSMFVPTQSDYLNLALEVYNRCRPLDPQASPLLCASAIQLAETVPKSINFRLAADKGSPLEDGRSLHIACSKSSDQRWLSVAWSDGKGALQTSVSYCLRHRTRGAARMISEIRNEIWATTKYFLDKSPTRWKVVLVSTEPADADDLEAWAEWAEKQNKLRPGTMELMIVAVNTTPDLVLEPPMTQITTSVLNSQFSSTPVTTPNPTVNVASPEQSGNALTPSATYNALTPTEPVLEPDADVVLTDICDESWGVILSHQLNVSPHITEFRPALASGYLLRRRGTSDADGVFPMTVNLIYSQRSALSHESVLKDILGMYRDLASLARARGIRSVQGNTMPWHIATALRAQELLSYVL